MLCEVYRTCATYNAPLRLTLYENMINYWIQKTDYSSFEKNDVDADLLLAAFNQYDWSAELIAFNESDESNNCPAGMGINIDGALLHVCPNDKDSLFFNYHYVVEGKWLGLIPFRKPSIHYVKNYNIKDVEKLLMAHINGEKEKILSIK